MTPFEIYTRRKFAECQQKGLLFNDRELSRQFVPYYNSQQRIEVDTGGTVLRGYVGVTTGWTPSFFLMLKANSIGSPWILSDSDKILRTFPKWR